ncbi:hypothetical protein PMKS-001731 [Pichia membranifaciens]|uniref:CCHC-type domain-containing protein n=1 Tax=Pichia membranifaciens TaxID=4926 RepID=A0A1Q2YFK4_9ASCO|nr:hypothetical protein PMKS-001731 [Pichia membranifaciens]
MRREDISNLPKERYYGYIGAVRGFHIGKAIERDSTLRNLIKEKAKFSRVINFWGIDNFTQYVLAPEVIAHIVLEQGKLEDLDAAYDEMEETNDYGIFVTNTVDIEGKDSIDTPMGEENIEFIVSEEEDQHGTDLPEAEDCDQAERLCYNCKQPNHESKDCPLPKQTVQKQCYNCKEIGHVQSECSLPVRSSQRCYTCGKFGHISKDCHASSKLSCYKCGEANHFAKDCQAAGPKCYNCGLTGHISRECDQAAQDVAPKLCYNCNEEGHISRLCPNAA